MHPLTPVWDILMYVVLPLWVFAGFLDYLCHRATHLEQAAGPRESLLHWAMILEVGLPIIVAVFLKIDATVMVFMIACLVAHEITGHADLKLAMATRTVTAFEQQVHSALEILPLAAMLLIFILHWPQAQALVGQGPEHADFSLTLKQAPAWSAIIPPLIGFALLTILPYGEELWRSVNASR